VAASRPGSAQLAWLTSASSSRVIRSAGVWDAKAPVPLAGTGAVRPSFKWWMMQDAVGVLSASRG